MKSTLKVLFPTLLVLFNSLSLSGQNSVFKVIQNNPELQKFEEALIQTGLNTTFASNGGTYTVFAPTNTAMLAVPQATLNNTASLRDFILTHCINGYYKESSLINGFSIATMNKRNLTVKKTGGVVLINGSTITKKDIFASNGIVHIINQVIFKVNTTETTVMSIVSNGPELTTLENVIIRARMTDKFTEPGSITLFAPTNEAFNKLSSEKFEDLIGTNVNLIRNAINYHVANKILKAADFIDGTKITMANEQQITVKVNINGTFVNNSLVTFVGIEAVNGIVYVIKDVLLPQPLPKYTILDFINQSPTHTKLKSYVTQSNTTAQLDAKGSMSFFAATNTAFSKLHPQTVAALEGDPLGLLKDAIQNHLLSKKQYTDELVDKSTITAINGFKLSIKSRINGVFVNEAKITIENVEVDNGIVHVIDEVLIDENIRFTVRDVIKNEESLSAFNAQIEKQKVDSLLNTDGPFTVFAPSNIAMSALPAEVVNAINSDDKMFLLNFIYNHITSQTLLSTNLSNNLSITAYNGFVITVKLQNSNILLNDVPIRIRNIEADNGVVHIIDTALYEEALPNTIYQYISANVNHSVLKTLIDKVNFKTLYDAPALLTLLAPTDQAFLALEAADLESLYNGPNSLVIDLLFKHTLNSSVSSGMLGSLTTVTNASTESLNVTILNGDIYINNAKIIVKDIILDNGIVHVIDAIIADPPPKNSIWDIIQNSSEHTIFETTIINANLQEKFDLEAPITVFGPTDDAFEVLGQAGLTELLNDPIALNELLLFHTHDRKLNIDNIQNASFILMQNGMTALIQKEANNYTINGINISITSFPADNGIFFSIDGILQPLVTRNTIYDIVCQEESLSDLKLQIDAASLANLLIEDGELTLFAPTNTALATLPSELIEAFNNDPNGLLKEFLNGHLHEGILKTEDMNDNMAITMKSGEKAVISIRIDGIYINDSKIQIEDMIADNGIVHIITPYIEAQAQRVTAYDIVSAESTLSTFKSAIDAASLISMLRDSQLVSVFAPTNAAFNQLDPNLLQDLFNDPSGLLRDAINFHLSKSLVLTSFLVDGSIVVMRNGKVTNITVNSNGIYINDSKIIVEDIIVDNGVVHIVDMVIMPPDDRVTVYDILSLNPNLSIFKSLVDSTQLDGLLENGTTLTVFAPTNQAFHSLPTEVFNELISDAGNTLKDIIARHIVDGKKLYKSNLLHNLQIKVSNNTFVIVNLRADGLYINDSKIITYDIEVDNGIVHILETAILPLSSSIDDLFESSNKFVLSPNPTHSQIRVACEECKMQNVNMKIYDNIGRLQIQISDYRIGTNIDVQNLSPGLYHITTLNDPKNTISFIKE